MVMFSPQPCIYYCFFGPLGLRRHRQGSRKDVMLDALLLVLAKSDRCNEDTRGQRICGITNVVVKAFKMENVRPPSFVL